VTLVAILTVRRDALEQFRAFERHAAAVMRAHGGRIERTVVVLPMPLRPISVTISPGAIAKDTPNSTWLSP